MHWGLPKEEIPRSFKIFGDQNDALLFTPLPTRIDDSLPWRTPTMMERFLIVDITIYLHLCGRVESISAVSLSL